MQEFLSHPINWCSLEGSAQYQEVMCCYTYEYLTCMAVKNMKRTFRDWPDLEVGACNQVSGELLDEWEQYGLVQGAGSLTKHLLRVDGLTHVQYQVQIGCRQGLEKQHIFATSSTKCFSCIFFVETIEQTPEMNYWWIEFVCMLCLYVQEGEVPSRSCIAS